MKKEKNETYGIISFVCGLFGLIAIMNFYALFFAIAGIVFGNMQNKIKKTGLAKAGIIMGWIAIAIGIITLLFVGSLFFLIWYIVY